MPSAMPKSPYKFTPYILGPRQGRVHLADGAPPWFSGPQPVPGMVGVNYDQLNAPPSAPAPPQVEEPEEQPGINPEYAKAIDNMKALYAERPVQEPAHWWQRAIAGGLGALAGASNAAGRTKHPIDVTSATQNILHPGYQEKLQNWQGQQAQAQGPLDLEAARQNAELKAQQIAGQAESRNASAEWRRELANPHHNQQQLDPAYARENFPWMRPDESGQFWVDKTVANTIQKPVKETAPPRPVIVPAGATVLGEDGKPLFTAPGKALAPTKPLVVKPGDTLLDENHQVLFQAPFKPLKGRADPNAPRPFTPQQQDSIKAKKDNDLRTIASRTDAILRDPHVDDDVKSRAMEDEANNADSVQREFESRIETHTKEPVPHFDMYTFTRQRRQQIEGARNKPSVPGAAPPTQQGQHPSVQVGQQVMVGGRPATVTGINPQTGKPIVKFQ